jgi:DNA mismatch repair protein MutL
VNKIKVLVEEVANRIAAGEVVERPVSVVKELVENSIDAKATAITVKIESGGKRLIQVVDNGYGMSENDALQAFERHATSKINTVEDIFSISSLGFRGEALPSIASVSNLELITKAEQNSMATKIVFKSGKLIDVSKTASNTGTIVTVKNLFANIPARKKFLKTDQTEYKHIIDYIHYQSIQYPKIHFAFIVNGSEKLNYPAVGSKEERLAAIFGSNFLKKDLIPIQIDKNNIGIDGYIGGLEDEFSELEDYRYLFVNGRFIKDRIIFHSIRTAYEPFIKKTRMYKQNKLPPFILFLSVDPHQVDFNVHPAKLELRFRDPGMVHSFVKNALSNALMEYEETKFRSIQSKLKGTAEKQKTTSHENVVFKKRTPKPSTKEYKKKLTELYQPDLFKESEKVAETEDKPYIFVKPEEDIINPWQLHQSYIFVQVEDGLIIIDQHAAHERILYEKMLHRIHGAPPTTQKLLFPIVINLPNYMKLTVPQIIRENMEIFNNIGFSLKSFSDDSLVIDEIPSELEHWDGGDVFVEILAQMLQEYKQTEDFRDSVAKSVSCKAALKAGKKMSKREMLELINNLFACEVPYFCPHGRPLIIKMPLEEFEKRFKRI